MVSREPEKAKGKSRKKLKLSKETLKDLTPRKNTRDAARGGDHKTPGCGTTNL